MSRPYVQGVDLSLVSTGIGVYYREGPVFANHVGEKGHTNASWLDRGERIDRLVGMIFDASPSQPPALAVIEGPTPGAKGGHPHDRAGAWWLVVRAWQCWETPVAVVPPRTLTRWATGNGNSDKAARGIALGRRFMSVGLENDDEVVGLALATMGAQWLGWVDATSKVQRECLEKCAWPERESVLA